MNRRNFIRNAIYLTNLSLVSNCLPSSNEISKPTPPALESDDNYLGYYLGFEDFDYGLIDSDRGEALDLGQIKIANSFSCVDQSSTTENQFSRGTCASFASACAVQAITKKNISEQHLYNRAWHKSGSGAIDGTSVEANLEVLYREGVVLGNDLEYNGNFISRNPPQDPLPNLTNIQKYKGPKYKVVEAGKNAYLLACQLLHLHHRPVLLMVEVLNDAGWLHGRFISQNSFSYSSEPISYHLVTAHGYDLKDQTLLIQNSWGLDWGTSGYVPMDASYVINNTIKIAFFPL